MILKFRIGHIRITFTLARVVDVLGVNSKLPDGNHILMWDFDNIPLDKIIEELQDVKRSYGLPRIYILKTSEPNNYIAYCFKRCNWRLARAIVGSTDYIDENFFKWAVFRRRFTLRVGAKLGVTPKCEAIINSMFDEDASIDELYSWVKYETLDGHHNQKVHFIEVP